MKALLAGICLLFSATTFGLSAGKGMQRVSIGGSEYVRLSDWAAGAGLNLHWIKRDEVLEVKNSSARLMFTSDSRKADIGGNAVLLSLPMINNNHTPYLSVVDLETTIQPILYPKKDARAKIRTICLDPGHGGKDTGKIDRNNFEKKYTLLLALEVSALLNKNGFRVVMTRKQDDTLDLSERPFFARRNAADLFISLHYNAASDPGVRGVEVYCLTPPGFNSSNEGGGRSEKRYYAGNVLNDYNTLLGFQMLRTITHSLPLEDRGLKRSRFEVLREARMPGILIEGGFMTSAADGKLIYDAAFRKKMAQAIVNGILAYRSQVETTTVKPPPKRR